MRHDGQADPEGSAELAPGCNWLTSAEGSAAQWADEEEWAQESAEDDSQCDGRVKNQVFSRKRIPIAGTK